MELPQILPHTIEVFPDHEKLANNLQGPSVPMIKGGTYCEQQGPCTLLEGKFLNFNGHTKDEEDLARQAQLEKNKIQQLDNQAQDINQSNIPWRILQKQLTEYIKKYQKQNQEELTDDAYAINGDAMTECGVWDATCQKERSDITCKKQRKLFKSKSITVRMVMRNPLLVAIELSKVRLQCHYQEEDK